MLKTRQYDILNTNLQDLHDRFKTGHIDTYQFAYHYDTLEMNLSEGDIELLNDWVEQSENKLFAYLLRGSIYSRLGREARGNRYFKDTPEEQLILMQRYYDQAAADLETVLLMDPHTLIAYRHLYNISATDDYKNPLALIRPSSSG